MLARFRSWFTPKEPKDYEISLLVENDQEYQEQLPQLLKSLSTNLDRLHELYKSYLLSFFDEQQERLLHVAINHLTDLTERNIDQGRKVLLRTNPQYQKQLDELAFKFHLNRREFLSAVELRKFRAPQLTELNRSLVEISELFRELSSHLSTQEKLIDNIETNLEITQETTRAAEIQLHRTSKYRTYLLVGTSFIIALTLLIFILS